MMMMMFFSKTAVASKAYSVLSNNSIQRILSSTPTVSLPSVGLFTQCNVTMKPCLQFENSAIMCFYNNAGIPSVTFKNDKLVINYYLECYHINKFLN